MKKITWYFHLLICLLAAGLPVATPQLAWAHAFPDHSEPRVGSTVQGSPAFVRIWFDGALESAFTTIVVKDSTDLNIDRGNGRVNPSDPTLLEVELPVLPPGTYRVFWDVLARDGHRTKGDYTFTVK
jgi:methionine-rich copper-binding protein CopC